MRDVVEAVKALVTTLDVVHGKDGLEELPPNLADLLAVVRAERVDELVLEYASLLLDARDGLAESLREPRQSTCVVDRGLVELLWGDAPQRIPRATETAYEGVGGLLFRRGNEPEPEAEGRGGTPRDREGLATTEALRRHGDGCYHPLSRGIIRPRCTSRSFPA